MTRAAGDSQARKIVVEEIFPHAPEVVWKALTSATLMARWLKMTPVGFEAVVGNQFTYQTDPAGDWDGTIQCRVTELIPNQRFVYSWQGGHARNDGYGSLLDTVVAFTLDPVAGGTRLRMVHSGFERPRNDSAYRNMSGGWTDVLRRLGELTRKQ